MANISLNRKAPHYLRVYINDLSPGWTSEYPVRTATWYITDDLEANLIDATYIGEQELDGGIENSRDEPFIFEDLSPDTEYKIFCVITSPTGTVNGSPMNPIYVELSNSFKTLKAPVITRFTVHNTEDGSLEFTDWDFSASNYYSEDSSYATTYSLYARRYGSEDWWPKIENATIPDGGVVDYPSFFVDNYGIYEFLLILDTRGYKVEKEAFLIAIANPYPINTTNFNTSTSEGSLNIVINWKVDFVYDDTVYRLYLQKKTESGSTRVGSFEGNCFLDNELIIEAPEYGEYCIYILYLSYGLNNGNNYYSDWFTVASGNRPLLWEWTSPMTGQLTVDENKEVHPVTAIEWNEFTNRLMELKNCFVSEGFVLSDFPTNFLIAEPNVEIKDLYNEVSSALSYLCSETHGNITDIYILSNRTELSARLFTSLQDNLNYLIGYL